MRAYHYTSRRHAEVILEEGVLKRTESNLDLHVPRKGPDVVWLLDGPDLGGFSHGLIGSAVDKTEIRFTVEVDDRWVKPWNSWADAQEIKKDWKSILTKIGGGEAATNQWFVSFRSIPSDQWILVENLKRKTVLWAPEKDVL